MFSHLREVLNAPPPPPFCLSLSPICCYSMKASHMYLKFCETRILTYVLPIVHHEVFLAFTKLKTCGNIPSKRKSKAVYLDALDHRTFRTLSCSSMSLSLTSPCTVHFAFGGLHEMLMNSDFSDQPSQSRLV